MSTPSPFYCSTPPEDVDVDVDVDVDEGRQLPSHIRVLLVAAAEERRRVPLGGHPSGIPGRPREGKRRRVPKLPFGRIIPGSWGVTEAEALMRTEIEIVGGKVFEVEGVSPSSLIPTTERERP